MGTNASSLCISNPISATLLGKCPSDSDLELPLACEIFYEFCKQVAGFEAAQVRNQEAVKRHFRLSCVAQSLLQQAACEGKKSERFAFAKDEQTVGQRLYSLTREVYQQLLHLIEGLLAQGRSCQQVLEVIMPA